ncbi:MAG TPA: hypothetical protein EYQ50_30000 [Verrucomicrobiales bacterium]|nr:hypothetical protein [Verrucomicrobiales bacterium]
MTPDLGCWVLGSSGLTHIRSDGNRFINGSTHFLETVPRDIKLKGAPAWLVGIPWKDAVVWAVVLENGTVQGFQVSGSSIQEISISPSVLPVGMPPMLYLSDEGPRLLSPLEDSSPWSHPVLLNQEGKFGYIGREGSLVIGKGSETVSLEIDALPDAKILVDEKERLLFLASPTSVYPHGVLGDSLEASRIVLVNASSEPRIVSNIEVNTPFVIEGIAPLWVDFDQDGKREIVVTVSDSLEGAKLVVYSEEGNLIAESAPIGRGFRWRNQMPVAALGPEGEMELVDILTPHVGGTLQFFQLRNQELVRSVFLKGFTSHRIGSRNLDLGMTGDFTRSGRAAVLVPNDARNSLGIIRHDRDGAKLIYSLPIGGSLSGNPMVVNTSDGGLALAVGRSDGHLRIWQSPDRSALFSIRRVEGVNKRFSLELSGSSGQDYVLESTPDLGVWDALVLFEKFDANNQSALTVSADEPALFYRSRDISTDRFATVLSADAAGNSGAYTVEVEVSSPDLGCDQYADWWKILSESGELLYRRILAHSHVAEQPFVRRGGPVPIAPNQIVWIRAHMNSHGYGRSALRGSVEDGFIRLHLSPRFASEVEFTGPLPASCLF